MALVETDYPASESYDNYQYKDLISEFGDEDDLWGADEITVEQLNDPTFSVKFDADLGAGTYRVDNVTVEVFYEVPISPISAPDLPPWRDQELQSGCIARSASGQKKFVIVGKNGLMRVSDDGETWVDQESGVGDTLRDATYTEQGVVAVGDQGTVIISADTVSWTKQDSDSTESLVGVAYNFQGGNTIAVGTNGVIRSRPNNSSLWEKRNG